mgnify:CR=1 FL=1
MNKFSLIAITIATFALAMFETPALAQSPFAAEVDLRVTNQYRVNRDYFQERLLSVEAFQASAATGTLTIARVRAGRTNTVGTITLASSHGIYRTTNTVWLFRGDILKFTHSGGATSSVVEIVGELSP